VEGVEDKGGDVAGYMPLQRQVGFIYDNPNLFIIAHELGHGAFNLRHTFSPENFIAAERTTQNLMDYNGGTELWAHQWELIRDPQNIWFAWSQDEGEGEMSTSCANSSFSGFDISVNLPDYLPVKSDTINCKINFSQKPDSIFQLSIKLKDKKQMELLNSTSDEIKAHIDTTFYNFKLVCKEYWSYGSIEAILGNDSINVDTLNFEVPIDTDDDYIADYWELLPGNGSSLSLGGNAQDGNFDDETSRNCPNNGDGFTKLDEYMGYTWNNVHHRLSPNRKEIFFNSSLTSYGNFIRKEFADQLDVDTIELGNKPVLLFCGLKHITNGVEIQDKNSSSGTNNGIFIQNSIPMGHGANLTFGQCRGDNKGNCIVDIYTQTFKNIYQNNSIHENFQGSFTFPIADSSGLVIYEAVYDSTDINGNGINTDLINPFDLLSPKNPTRPNTKADNDPIDNRIAGIDLNTAIENNVIHEAGHAVGMALTPGNPHPPTTGYSPMRSCIGPAHNDKYTTNDINQFILK